MSVYYNLGLLVSLKLTLIIAVSGDTCLSALRRSSGTSDPPFTDSDYDPLPASNAVQAIITTYKFQCDCNITSWETYVKRDGRFYASVRAYDIIFQVWRPSPTVQDDGCYSLVGENVFSRFSFANSGLVQLTPTSPNNSIITAQVGDVVGYYTNSHLQSNDGIQLEGRSDYDENLIWFLSLADGSLTPSGDSACPYPVGTGRYLSSSTAAAPMLRISADAITCPASELSSSPSSSVKIYPSELVPLPKSLASTQSVLQKEEGTSTLVMLSPSTSVSPSSQPKISLSGTTSTIDITPSVFMSSSPSIVPSVTTDLRPVRLKFSSDESLEITHVVGITIGGVVALAVAAIMMVFMLLVCKWKKYCLGSITLAGEVAVPLDDPTGREDITTNSNQVYSSLPACSGEIVTTDNSNSDGIQTEANAMCASTMENVYEECDSAVSNNIKSLPKGLDQNSLVIMTETNEAYSSLATKKQENVSTDNMNCDGIQTEVNAAYTSTMENVYEDCDATVSNNSESLPGTVDYLYVDVRLKHLHISSTNESDYY